MVIRIFPFLYHRQDFSPPSAIGKIWFFGVKSWFFTRNTPKIFAPPSTLRNFFTCAPPNLKSWIRPCYYTYAKICVTTNMVQDSDSSAWYRHFRPSGIMLTIYLDCIILCSMPLAFFGIKFSIINRGKCNKSGGFVLVICAQTSTLSEMVQLWVRVLNHIRCDTDFGIRIIAGADPGFQVRCRSTQCDK
jgi:hypothetical protein